MISLHCTHAVHVQTPHIRLPAFPATVACFFPMHCTCRARTFSMYFCMSDDTRTYTQGNGLEIKTDKRRNSSLVSVSWMRGQKEPAKKPIIIRLLIITKYIFLLLFFFYLDYDCYSGLEESIWVRIPSCPILFYLD